MYLPTLSKLQIASERNVNVFVVPPKNNFQLKEVLHLSFFRMSIIITITSEDCVSTSTIVNAPITHDVAHDSIECCLPRAPLTLEMLTKQMYINNFFGAQLVETHQTDPRSSSIG
uniref:Uncharacterized protein n=1 Tax=Glossina palpalis gambiensis TaxID=67801 RepID=A0A1B0B022_9MUSC